MNSKSFQVRSRSALPPFLALLALLFIDAANAQVPTIRFASDQVFVSQRNGSVSIPVVIENSENIEQWISFDWTASDGTAQVVTNYGPTSHWDVIFGYRGRVTVYPNQSTRTINIPIRYTATLQDHSFSVMITSTATPSFVPNGAIGVPSACVVTIESAASFVQSVRSKIARVNRKIKRAKRIRDSKVRSKRVKRFVAQKRELLKLIRPS